MRIDKATRLVVVAALLAAACSGGTDAASEDTTTSPPTTAATTTTTMPEPEPTTTSEAPAATAAPTTAAPTTTAVPTTTAAPAVPFGSLIGGEGVGDGWLAPPGRYSSDQAGMSLEFELAEPVTWFEQNGRAVVLGHADLSDRDRIWIASFVGVIPSAEVGTHPPHDPVIPANTTPIPADLEEWFDAAPQVSVTGSGDTATAESTARYWDVAVDTAGGTTFDCHLGRCVASFVHGEWGAFVFGDEYLFRIYQLDGPMSDVIVFTQGTPANFAAMTSLSELVVGGMSTAG